MIMSADDVNQLKRAAEAQHGCTARIVQSTPVKETFGGKTVWKGVVHVSKITGHPTTTQAYAWSSPIEGSDRRQFFAVLHVPPITSPVEQLSLFGRLAKQIRTLPIFLAV